MILAPTRQTLAPIKSQRSGGCLPLPKAIRAKRRCRCHHRPRRLALLHSRPRRSGTKQRPRASRETPPCERIYVYGRATWKPRPLQSRAAMKTHLLSQQQRSDEQQHKKQQQEVFYVGRFFSCSFGIIKMDKIAPPENKHANLTINQTSILLSSEALGILRRLPVIRVHPGKAVELENDAILLLDDEGKFNFILPMGGKTLLDSKSHLIGTCS